MKKKYKQNWDVYIWILKSVSLPFVCLLLFLTPIVGNLMYCNHLYEKGEITEKGLESCLWFD